MCYGWNPFYGEDTQHTYKNILFGKVLFPRSGLRLEGRNFVKRLLNRNPKHRLGAEDGAEELKRHPFFSDVDWEALSEKSITPPFEPTLTSEIDTSNFDPEFTNALNEVTSPHGATARIAISPPLSPGMQANFKGFSFVSESLMDKHMRSRGVQDDSYNTDDGERRDHGWEGDILDTPEDDNMLNGNYFEM
jgi:serine/threonine protein kinase